MATARVDERAEARAAVEAWEQDWKRDKKRNNKRWRAVKREVARNELGQWPQKKEDAKQRIRRQRPIAESHAFVARELRGAWPASRAAGAFLRDMSNGGAGRAELVLLACLLVAYEQRKPFVILSHDELAWLAGCSKSTAERARRQLRGRYLVAFPRFQRLKPGTKLDPKQYVRAAGLELANKEMKHALCLAPGVLERLEGPEERRRKSCRAVDPELRQVLTRSWRARARRGERIWKWGEIHHRVVEANARRGRGDFQPRFQDDDPRLRNKPKTLQTKSGGTVLPERRSAARSHAAGCGNVATAPPGFLPRSAPNSDGKRRTRPPTASAAPREPGCAGRHEGKGQAAPPSPAAAATAVVAPPAAPERVSTTGDPSRRRRRVLSWLPPEIAAWSRDDGDDS